VRDPLVAPLAALAAGILASRWLPLGSAELAAGVAALLLLALLPQGRGTRAACLLSAFLLAGAFTAEIHRPGPAPELDNLGDVILTGCVVEPPALAGDRERFTLELDEGARALVTIYEGMPRLDYGRRVELDARVRRPRNFGNPGAFDYVGYLGRKQVYWLASARASGVRVLPGECGSRFGGFIAGLRGAALERIARLYPGDAYHRGMLQAVLIGESYQLEKVWLESFRSTGTLHALIISGSHIAVLASVFLFLLRVCLAPTGAAAFLTVCLAWLYALVTGWQPPCVRAAAGLTLFLIGRHFYRRRSILNLLAAVAIGFLALDPEQLFEASFQLSFLAVAAIAVFAIPLVEATTGPLARGLRRLDDTDLDLHLEPRVAQFRVEMRLLAETLKLWTGLPAFMLVLPVRGLFYVVELFVVSAAVQAGLALPMVVYFHRLGFTGLSANVPVVFLLGWVVPLGFAALATGWTWVAQSAAVLLDLSRAVVDWHARLEPHWRIPAPPLWLGVALCVTLAAAATRRLRWPSVAASAALLAALVAHPFPPAVAPGSLELTAIDVGQGDALLLAFPDGRLMLVDTGGIPLFGERRAARMDIGEEVVSPYLWSRSIRRVDVLAVTHAHDDHMGGAPALVRNFRPAELWTGVDRAAIRGLGVPVRLRQAGERFAWGGAQIEVLAPAAGCCTGETPHNRDSLVLRVRYGRHAFLLAGDTDRDTESEIVISGADVRADVLKVAHHGSRTASSDAFLDAVRPAFGVISLAAGNLYRYPHREVLERFARRRAGLYRTDLDGRVSFRTDGRRLTLETSGYAGLFVPF